MIPCVLECAFQQDGVCHYETTYQNSSLIDANAVKVDRDCVFAKITNYTDNHQMHTNNYQ